MKILAEAQKQLLVDCFKMSHLEIQHKLKTLSEANLLKIIKVVWVEDRQLRPKDKTKK